MPFSKYFNAAFQLVYGSMGWQTYCIVQPDETQEMCGKIIKLVNAFSMVRDQCDQIGRYFGFWATDVRKYDRNSMDLLGKTLKPSAASLVNGYTTSVTRSGDFLDFGQLFKAFGNN